MRGRKLVAAMPRKMLPSQDEGAEDWGNRVSWSGRDGGERAKENGL